MSIVNNPTVTLFTLATKLWNIRSASCVEEIDKAINGAIQLHVKVMLLRIFV